MCQATQQNTPAHSPEKHGERANTQVQAGARHLDLLTPDVTCAKECSGRAGVGELSGSVRSMHVMAGIGGKERGRKGSGHELCDLCVWKLAPAPNEAHESLASGPPAYVLTGCPRAWCAEY